MPTTAKSWDTECSYLPWRRPTTFELLHRIRAMSLADERLVELLDEGGTRLPEMQGSGSGQAPITPLAFARRPSTLFGHQIADGRPARR